jgi:hypothetical protein
MGASVSSLPDHLSEQEFQQLCGTSYNPLHYSSLRSPADNQLHKEMIVLLTSADYEKEVFQLYLNYTPPNGELNSKIFVKFLKDTKSLNKNSFTSGDADILFTKFKNKYKTINYFVFRNEMLVEIAKKRNVELPNYLTKLAKHEGPILHATVAEANRFHDDKSTYTGAHAQGGPTFEASSGQSALSLVFPKPNHRSSYSP